MLLTHALNQRKISESRKNSVDVDAGGSDQYVVRIMQKVRGCTEENLVTLREFYDIGAVCRAVEGDIVWLLSDIDHPLTPPSNCPYLQTVLAPGTTFSSRAIRRALSEAIGTASLRTRYVNRPSAASVSLPEVVGFLGQNAWLNRSVIHYCLQQLAMDYAGLVVVDPLRPGKPRARPPLPLPLTEALSSSGVVFSINLARSHWGVIFVVFERLGRVRATLYEPLMDPTYAKLLGHELEHFCMPMIQSWFARDERTAVSLDAQWARQPKQVDGNSCGIHCIAKVFELASREAGANEWVPEHLSADILREWRLCLLWRVVCMSTVVEAPKDAEEVAVERLRAFTAFRAAAKGK